MLIFTFSLLAAFATILGGAIPLLHKRLSHESLTLLIAFSAGVLLSTGLNHMVVESYTEAGKWAMVSVSIGFILLYGYEKMALVHTCREESREVHHFGTAAIIGLGFHSFLDGFAIAVSVEFQKTLGLLVVSAVLLHRLPTGLSIASIMLANRFREAKAWMILSIIAILAVIGALVGIFIPVHEQFVLSLAVGLSGGIFLYIATGDLLPLAHENSQDYRVPVFFLIGFVGVLGTSFLT